VHGEDRVCTWEDGLLQDAFSFFELFPFFLCLRARKLINVRDFNLGLDGLN